MKKRTILISMPFGALERQALGLSLLKARLAENSLACSIKYLTFTFAEFIGAEEYYYISTELPHTAFAGEWIFTASLYGHRDAADAGYVKEVLQNTWQLDDAAIQRIMRARAVVVPFLDYCMATIPWQDFDLVGFTSTFEQNIASLALAKRIKQTHPGIEIVFGGGNWEDEMGMELHRQFPFVDYVCPGEADDSFPALVKALSAGRPKSKLLNAIRGVIYRRNGKSVSTGPPDLIRDMDKLPIPDYSDYFCEFEQSSTGSFVVPSLLFESSRGCWWGARSQCTFCGLNGSSLTFRAKSGRRAHHELGFLIDRWGIEMVQVVDNVLNMKYFQDFFPALSQSKRSVNLFYEIRANLNRKHVRMLRDARVCRVQPGIESLSDHVLNLMHKGTTALQNIQVLKWCKEYDINADWNLLYGFPGETRQDYSRMIKLLARIRFLNPPTACGPIRLDRFSQFYKRSEKFGLTNVSPIAPYRHIYPFADDILQRIAYYFDFDYEPAVDPSGYADEVIRYVEEWQQHPDQGELRSIARPDGTLVLFDSRSEASRSHFELTGMDRQTYEYCDTVRSFSSIAKHLRQIYPNREFSDRQVLLFLQWLIDNMLMVSSEGHYLSLAIQTNSVDSANPVAVHQSGFALPA